MLVCGWNARVKIIVTAHPAAIAAVVRARNCGPQPILSMLFIAAMSTLGSRLKCISAMWTPPNAESTVRLTGSATCGSALRRARSQARCGQRPTWKISSAHASHGARFS